MVAAAAAAAAAAAMSPFCTVKQPAGAFEAHLVARQRAVYQSDFVFGGRAKMSFSSEERTITAIFGYEDIAKNGLTVLSRLSVPSKCLATIFQLCHKIRCVLRGETALSLFA